MMKSMEKALLIKICDKDKKLQLLFIKYLPDTLENAFCLGNGISKISRGIDLQIKI